jgi:septal ring factor EnvC (AmiA/AmiB activator)
MGKVSNLGYMIFPSLTKERDRLVSVNHGLLTFLAKAHDRQRDLEKMLEERSETLALKTMECERLKTANAMLQLDQKPIEGRILKPKTAADVRRIMEERATEEADGIR